MAYTPLGTTINTFDTEWIGTLHEQTPKFLAGWVDETIRNRLFLSKLRKDGRIVLNSNSPLCVWTVKYAQPQIQSAGDVGNLVFQRNDLMRQAAQSWRGYIGTDEMTEKEYLMNRGPGQIFNRYGEIVPWLMEAMTDSFGGQLFIDGDAANNVNCIHGLNSFTGYTACTTSDLIAQPNDSYGGLSTVLQAESGGTWTATLSSANRPNTSLSYDWPYGTGNAQYDFFSPKLLNFNSARWMGSTGSATWETVCERVLRQGRIWLTSTGGMAGRPKMVLLSPDFMAGFLNHQSAKQRIIVPHKESEDLGFANTVNFEGMSVGDDYECPVSTGFMLTTQNIELASLDNVLFGYRGPDWSIRDRAWLFYVGFWGNMRFRPKHIAKIADFTS